MQLKHTKLIIRANEDFTRTIEIKHASGQEIEGTIVCKEYFSDIRHYPILGKDGESKKQNEELKMILQINASKKYILWKVTNYQYINQGQAIEQGMQTAKNILELV